MRRIDLRGDLLAAMAATVCTVMPAAAHAEDLVDIYRLAQGHDPVYEAARYALQAAEQKRPQARAGLLPTIALSGSSGQQKGDAAFGDAPYVRRDVRNWGWSLQLTQPLFRAANAAAVGVADAQVRQASAQFSLAEQALMLRVAQAYFDVLTAQDAVQAAEAQVKAVNEQLSLAQHSYRAGTATVTDVHEAKSRFDLARAQRVAALNDRETRLAELERIMGTQPSSMSGLGKAVDLPSPQPADLFQWMIQARERNPAVVAQQAATEAAERELRRNRAEHLPTLDFTASYGSNYASGALSSPADIATRTRAGQVGLQLTIPLFAGGGTQARVNEAAANLNRSRADAEAVRRQAAMEARQAFAGVSNGLAQVEALVSAVESSKSSVEANQVGYRTGTRINIDVLNAEQQLYAAVRDLAKARYETIMQSLKLKAAAGELGEADLQAVNALLETPTPVALSAPGSSASGSH